MAWQKVDGDDENWQADEFIPGVDGEEEGYDPSLCGPEYRMWLGLWELEIAEYHGMERVMKALGAQHMNLPPEG